MIPDTPSVASPGQQKLQPFLLLARSARGASSAVEVIKSALSAPGVLVFAELLQSPSIAALSADPTGAPWFRLASIFSYGTYSDYLAEKGSLPPLTEEQARKLRILSLVSLAENQTTISYEAINAALDLDSVRGIEDIIVEAIDHNIIAGEIDQIDALLHVSHFAPRDPRPDDLAKSLALLREWVTATEQRIADIDAKILHVQEASECGGREKAEMRAAYTALQAMEKGKVRDIDYVDDTPRNRRKGKRPPKASGKAPYQSAEYNAEHDRMNDHMNIE